MARSKIIKADDLSYITDREIEMIKLLNKGLEAKEIGKELNLSKKTIESWKYKLYKTFKLKNSIQLINMAKKKGLIYLLFLLLSFSAKSQFIVSGGGITYARIGPSMFDSAQVAYLVAVKLIYENNPGNVPPDSIWIYVYDNDTNLFYSSRHQAIAEILDIDETDVPCLTPGQPLFNLKRVRYGGTFNLAPNNSGYTAVWQGKCL